MDESPRSSKRRRLSAEEKSFAGASPLRPHGKARNDDQIRPAPENVAELEQITRAIPESNGHSEYKATESRSNDGNTQIDTIIVTSQLENGNSEPVETTQISEIAHALNGTSQAQDSPAKRKRGRPRKQLQSQTSAENTSQKGTPKNRKGQTDSRSSPVNASPRLSLEQGSKDVTSSKFPGQDAELENGDVEVSTPSRRREKRKAAVAAARSWNESTENHRNNSAEDRISPHPSEDESGGVHNYSEEMSKLPAKKLVGILTPSKRKHGTPKKIVTFGNVNQGDAGLDLGFKDIPKETRSTEQRPVDDVASNDRPAPSPANLDPSTIGTPKRKRGRPPKRTGESMLPYADDLTVNGVDLRGYDGMDLDVDAENSRLETTRSLFEGIEDLSEKLDVLQKVLMQRITGRGGMRVIGHETEYRKVHQLVKQTVVAGEGNSMLVIGARGTGKTVLVESVISSLKREHDEEFHVIRLDGFFQTDDRLALREIWRQLGREMDEEEAMTKSSNYADTLSSFLALLSHPSELSETEEAGQTSKSVVFIINEFDLFAAHPRQTLLYNLFDIAQSRKAPIAVIGATTRVDIMESLEKRVKSRFSHRYVHLSPPPNIPAFWEICRYFLSIERDQLDELEQNDRAILDSPGGLKLIEAWKMMMNDLYTNDIHFRAHLHRIFYQSKSIRAFLNSALVPISSITTSSLPVRGVAFIENDLLPPDSKLHLLPGLSDLALSMLIAAARLDVILDTDVCNFNMAYDQYCSLAAKAKVQSFTTSSYSSLAMSPGGGLRTGAGSAASDHGTPSRASPYGTPSRSGYGTPSTSAPTTPSRSNTNTTTTISTAGGTTVKLWPRHLALAAWETLLDVELLVPASASVGALAAVAGRAGRMVRVDVALEEIAPSVPGLTGLLAKWCREI
ncbi:hypothetical protein L228DRAFT_280574 [Xylona heveae TC161]|uniref:Origin recognition complex subunit 4 n=1 Tax=Xylona heveae (strain CBS 132557 / TC161) TaxID=1328760 RepID=A0A165ISM2_XYLHT|nr:hypothetical protein L228DRAFT_280574 [Xylona heveae TC161]KZF25326.1 hypothetical protein L228DRAFT_280574 [Xylona heveae TC161]